MITRLKLRNFKAFESLDLELKPITMILGPNNSGKSSIISPFRLLIQTMESYDQDVPLLLDGVLGDFGTFKDIVFGNHRGRVFEIGYSVNTSLFGEESEMGVDLAFKYRSKRRELILKKVQVYKENRSLLVLNYSEESERMTVASLGGRTVPSQYKASYSRRVRLNHFAPHLMFSSPTPPSRKSTSSDEPERFRIKNETGIMRQINQTSTRLERELVEMDFIGAMRVPPDRTYLFSGEKRKRIGASGENAASLLVMDASRKGLRRINLSELVSQWLKRAGMAEKLSIVPISDRHFEIRVVHPISRENQNLTDVGVGNSQVIPVIVGGYNLPPDSTYFVEEPEIHLHPKAQAELGNFFGDLYDRNIQAVVETHSEYLILRLQQLVAEGKIQHEDIAFYYVDSNPEGGKSVKKLTLDEQGRFTEDLPNGFFPERLEEAKRLSRIRYARFADKTPESGK